VLVATDMGVARGIITFKHDEEKTVNVDATKVLAMAGDQASRSAFGEYIQANIKLMRLQNDVELNNDACAHFLRREISRALRSRGPVQCNSLLAGVDAAGPALYFLDYLGSLQRVNYAAHGYSSNFALSIMDRYYKPGLSRDEARAIMLACVDQLQKRFLLHVPKFQLKIVSADGIVEEIVDRGAPAPEAAAGGARGAAASAVSAPA